MSLKTVVPAERLKRAQRALFEAMGQLAIVQSMVANMTEEGDWRADGRPRPLAYVNANERIGDSKYRVVIRESLSKMLDELERIDARFGELSTEDDT